MDSDRIEGKMQKAAGSVESGLGDALGDTQASFSGRVREARGAAQEALGDVKGKLGDAASHAITTAQDVYDNREEYAIRSKRSVEAQVIDNPLLALSLAALVGLFIGALLGGHRR